MRTLLQAIVAGICIAVLTGCATSHKYANRSEGKLNGSELKADEQSQRMLIWRACLTIQVSDVAETVGKASAQVEKWGGYIEQKSDNGSRSANVTIRIPSKHFKAAVSDMEKLGKVTFQNITGEDVTEQYVDLDAKLKNLIALRDRLKQHLQKTADVKDIIAVEVELNRVQTEIDSLEGQSKSLKSKADYATIQLTLERKSIPGPLGYLFGGIGWCIEKLFVIRP